MQQGRVVRTSPDRWGRDGSVKSKDLLPVYTAFPVFHTHLEPAERVNVSTGIKANLSSLHRSPQPAWLGMQTPVSHVRDFSELSNKRTGKNIPGREYGDGIKNTASYSLLPNIFSLSMCLRHGVTLTRAAQSPGHSQTTLPRSKADTINHYLHVRDIEKCSRGWEKEHSKMAKRERTQSFPLICQRHAYI